MTIHLVHMHREWRVILWRLRGALLKRLCERLLRRWQDIIGNGALKRCGKVAEGRPISGARTLSCRVYGLCSWCRLAWPSQLMRLCMLRPISVPISDLDFLSSAGSPGLSGGCVCFVSPVCVSVARSNGSGSARPMLGIYSAGFWAGLTSGDTRGDVCSASGMLSAVSKTKKASPPSPNFIA